MRKKTGHVQNRETSWRISYYDIDHNRQFESYPTEDEAHAQLAQRLAEVAAGMPVSSKPNTVTFGELAVDVINDYKVNKFKSLDTLNDRFRKHIIPVFGKRKACQITTAQLKDYIVKRQADGAATGTINRELEAIRHTFYLARDGKKLLRWPKVPHLRENNVRTGFLTRAEVDRLCAHLRPPLDAFVLFGFLTGWRYGEIQALKWSNVDFIKGEIRLDPGTTKSGQGRVCPMSREIRTLLEGLATAAAKIRTIQMKGRGVAAVPTPSVFAVASRKKVDGKWQPFFGEIQAFRKQWRMACHKAGLPCLYSKDGKRPIKAVRTFHDLRRSFAREMDRKGVRQGAIMKLAGWETDSVFRRYNIVSDSDLRDAIDIVDGATDGAKTEGQGS